MRTDQIKTILRKARLFEHLGEEALERLAERAIKRTYAKGRLIFHQGDEARSLFVLVEGAVKVYVTSEDGDKMLLVTLRPPDVFGEIAILDAGDRSASAETLGPAELLEIGRDPFLGLLESDPPIMRDLLRGLGGVLRRLTDQTADLVFLDLPSRVAKFLVSSYESRGEKSGAGDLDLELTQGDIAALVGGSRQSVNQALKGLERRGYIEVTGRSIKITDPEGLRRRAGL